VPTSSICYTLTTTKETPAMKRSRAGAPVACRLRAFPRTPRSATLIEPGNGVRKWYCHLPPLA
jgi:hypothetical protein